MRTLFRGVLAATVFAVLATICSWPAAAAAPRTATAAPGLPSDPKVQGYIGFCDSAGHNVIGGDVRAKPFVWKAVASVPPPAAYQGSGQNAVLNAYQPRPDTLPAYWSGMSLTGASFYVNTKQPVVQSTYVDSSLEDFIQAFPPQVNGLYVLRIFWGKKNYGLYSAAYPATTIQVQGSRWHVVSGGTVNCSPAATKATSLEQLTGVATKQDVTPRTPAAHQVTAPAGTSKPIQRAPANVGSSGTGPGSAASGAAGNTPLSDGSPSSEASSTSSSTHSWVLWSLVAVVVLLAGALIFSYRGRRARLSAPIPIDDDQKD